jgi:tetratricopeptide (TPR) repeat protein
VIVNLSEIPNAFHLPRPNWEVIRAWVEQHVSESNRAQAGAEIADQWLQKLDDALGGGYRLEQGENLWVFAPRDHEQAGSVLGLAETALAEIVKTLGDAARVSWLGPLVILFFPNDNIYYSYVSQFYPEDGEFGASAGVCLSSGGYVHIALQPHQTLNSLEGTLLHEITHACLGHLKLPAWVNEGIAKLAEEPAWHRFTLDLETAEKIRKYWREHGLQNIWWGNGFHLPDEGQRCSYDLAQVLIHLIVADHPGTLPQFVRHAHQDDAGDGAARDFLGIGVAELAAQFLGDGVWEPVPPDASSYCRRGDLHAARGENNQAIIDFDEAIRLDPEYVAAYASRASAREQLGQHLQVIADYEKAIELDPEDLLSYNNLAWILATSPNEEHRNGERAIELATEACKLSGFDSWFCLGTLAAAYAEVGDFEEARNFAKESLRRAPVQERQGCGERLRLYKEERPYREVAHPSSDGHKHADPKRPSR